MNCVACLELEAEPGGGLLCADCGRSWLETGLGRTTFKDWIDAERRRLGWLPLGSSWADTSRALPKLVKVEPKP